jgi:hypothetical protein
MRFIRAPDPAVSAAFYPAADIFIIFFHPDKKGKKSIP